MLRNQALSHLVHGCLTGRALAFKIAVCVVGFAALEGVLAQAPPPAGGAGNNAPSGKDERGYKILEPNEKMLKEKPTEARVKGQVRQALLSPNPLDEQARRVFDSYYTLYFFPLMTRTTDEALKALPDDRQKFLRNDLENCRNQETQTHLTSLTFDEMLAIARDAEFHPAVRYNALLIVGSLNDRETVRLGVTPALPVPMARALPIILEEFRRPENSDALKVAALIGLSRHLEWDAHRTAGSNPIPAPLKAEVLGELMTLAQAQEPPAARSPQGHAWFRRRAIEALGLAGVAKVDPAVAAAFDKLLKDPTESLAIRFTVAAAIGKLKFEPPAKVDAGATAKELGYLALLACDSELNRIAELKKTEQDRSARLAKGVNTFSGAALPSGGAGGMEGAGAVTDNLGRSDVGDMDAIGNMPGMGAMGAMGGRSGPANAALDLKAYRFEFVRRRIRYHLYCVQLGLNGGQEKNPTSGMAAFAKAGADLEAVTGITADVKKLIDIVEVKAVDLAQLEKELRRSMKPLEAKTRKLAPPAPVAAPAGDLPAGDLPVAPAAAKPAAADADAPAAADIPADAPAAVPAPPAADAPAAPPAGKAEPAAPAVP